MSITPFHCHHPLEFVLLQEHADAINALLLSGTTYVTGIRNNETGEVRFHAWKSEWEESTLGWWNVGNMGCDCNRHLIFYDYTEESYNDDVSCDGERYTLVGVWFPDGGDIRDLLELNE